MTSAVPSVAPYKPPTTLKQNLDLLDRLKTVPQRLKNAPAKKYGKVGAGLLLGGIGFGYLLFPQILNFAIGKIVNLGENSDIRKIWKRIPQHFDFNVYVFNVTNPTEVQNGGIPVVEEIGPYCYEEWKEKVNLVDDPLEDTITYSNLNTWYFLKEKSFPLTGDEMVTIPNLPLMSVLLMGENMFPSPIMSILNAAVPKLYDNPGSIFMEAKVRDLLFDGILIDCRAKEMGPKVVCVAVKQNSKPLVKLGNNRYLFSFFGSKNATPEEMRLTVMKGLQDVYSIGKVVAVNGRPENTVWADGECRKLTGTDATIFPPFRKANNHSVVAFAVEICRSITGIYEKEGEYQGIKGHKYVVSLGDMKQNPGESCYCTGGRCLGKGATDLSKCQGAPIVGSLPHFYDSDEKYLNGVVGLHPDKDKHEITFIMEPTSGVPLVARKRFQFNIHLHPIRHVTLTKKLRSTLLPVFWVEENLDLGGEMMDFLEASLLTNLRLADGVKWTMILLGSGISIGGLVLHRMRKQAAKNTSHSREHLIQKSQSLAGGEVEGLSVERLMGPSVQGLERRLAGQEPPYHGMWTPQLPPVEYTPPPGTPSDPQMPTADLTTDSSSAPVRPPRTRPVTSKSRHSTGKTPFF